MDHDATREQLDLAAAEPGGLERLMAGDTATAQAVAAHLAGCRSLQRGADPAPALGRAHPCAVPPRRSPSGPAAVRAQGVPRPLAVAVVSGAGDVAAAAARAPTIAPDAAPASARRPPPSSSRHGATAGAGPAMVATIAAAVVLSVLTTTFVVGSRVDGQLAAQAETTRHSRRSPSTTLAVTAQPDAEHVGLAGAADPMSGQPGLLPVGQRSSRSWPSVYTAPGRPGVSLLGRASTGAPAGRQDVLRRRRGLLGRHGAGRRRPVGRRDVRRVAGRGQGAAVGASRSSSASLRTPGDGSGGLAVVRSAPDPAAQRRAAARRRRTSVEARRRARWAPSPRRRDPAAAPQGRRDGAAAGDSPRPGLTSAPSSARTADSQAASRGRSTASISASRRRPIHGSRARRARLPRRARR